MVFNQWRKETGEADEGVAKWSLEQSGGAERSPGRMAVTSGCVARFCHQKATKRSSRSNLHASFSLVRLLRNQEQKQGEHVNRHSYPSNVLLDNPLTSTHI
jgi:hypothetical protein